jgi:hypothetical protein
LVRAVSAARQPDSEPICEKPTVSDAADTLEIKANEKTADRAAILRFMIVPPNKKALPAFLFMKHIILLYSKRLSLDHNKFWLRQTGISAII